MARVGEAFIDLKTKLVNFKKGIGEAQGKLQNFGKFVRKNSQSFNDAGLALGAFSAGLVALGTKGVLSVAKFQKQLANISTMLDDTSMKFMPAYKKGLEELAIKYGESTQTLSKGLYDVLSASIDAADALDVLEVSATMARAGLTDTGVAADALTTILNAYQLEAKQAGDVSDLLFAIVKRGKTTMSELAPAIGIVATTASVAGLSLEEMGAMLATMTRSGINTRIAVTSLNAVMTGILKPTNQAKDAFKAITKQLGIKGLALDSATLKEKGLMGMVKLLNQATNEQIAQIFPNVRAFRGLAVALNDTIGFEKDLGIMTNRVGLTQEAFAKQTDTITFSFEVFAQKVEALFRKLGELLLPTVQKVINLFSKLLDWILELNPATVKLITYFTFLAGAIAGLAAPILLVLGNLERLTKIFILLKIAAIKLWATIAAHPWVAVTAALALAANFALDWAIANQEAKNSLINLRKSIDDLIKGHREEIEVIKEKMKNTKLSLEEQADLQIELLANFKAIKYQEIRLAKIAEDKKLAIAKKAKEEKDKLVEEELAKEKAYNLALYNHEVYTGQITLAQQRIDIEQQLANVKEGTIRELELKKQLYDLDQKMLAERNYNMKDGWFKALNAMQERNINWADNFVTLFEGLETGFENSFMAMMKTTGTFADKVKAFWGSLGDSVVANIQRMISKWLAFQALKGVANVLTGGLFSGITGGIKSILGMANGGVLKEPVLGVGARTGQSYAFGERENEVFMPESKLNNVGGMNNTKGSNYVFHISLYGADKDYADKLAGIIYKKIRINGRG